MQYMRCRTTACRPADALAQVFDSDEFAVRMKRQRAKIAAIDSGFFRRELFVA